MQEPQADVPQEHQEEAGLPRQQPRPLDLADITEAKPQLSTVAGRTSHVPLSIQRGERRHQPDRVEYQSELNELCQFMVMRLCQDRYPTRVGHTHEEVGQSCRFPRFDQDLSLPKPCLLGSIAITHRSVHSLQIDDFDVL